VYSILPKEGGQPLTGMRNFLKQKGQDVNVVLGALNITDLPSGEFRLQLEVRDRTNALLAVTAQPVHRSNRLGIKEYGNLAFVDISNTFVAEYTDEQIAYFVRSLRPIASEKEISAIATLRETDKPELRRQFFFNFWVERDPNEPQKPWSHYHVALQYVDNNYQTFNRKGYETDRGRVYLQYGPPNELHQSGFETNSAPYEIWQYNSIPNGETNVIFVFYEPDIVSNDYKLLHSNATGEIHNDQWKVILYGKDGRNRNRDFENTSTPDQFGTKVADPFEHQR
jgi:GWxTD domain-containing protein